MEIKITLRKLLYEKCTQLHVFIMSFDVKPLHELRNPFVLLQ